MLTQPLNLGDLGDDRGVCALTRPNGHISTLHAPFQSTGLQVNKTFDWMPGLSSIKVCLC